MGKLTSNYIFILLYQVILVLTPIFTTPYISRVLGPENIGIDAYVFSIVQIFQVLLMLGIGAHGKKQMASAVGEKAIQTEFSNIYSVQLSTTVLILIFYAFYVLQVPNYSEIFWGYTIILIATGLDVSWYFIGLEKMKQIMVRNIFVRLVSIVLIVLFVKSQTDLWKFVLINSLSLFFGQIINWFILIKEVKKFSFSFTGMKLHLKPILILAIIPCISIFYMSINKIVLGYVVGETEVGFYNQAYKLIVICMGFLSALSTVMMPRMVHYHAKGEEKKFKETVEFSLNYMILTTLPLLAIIVVMSDYLVPLFLGDGFSSVIYLLIILAPALLFKGLSDIFGFQILIAIGDNNSYAASVGVGAIFSLATNFLLVKNLDGIGTAIAYDVAIFVALLIQIYFSKAFISLKRIFLSFLKYGLYTSFMISILIYIKNYLNPKDNIIFLFIEISIAIITYISLLLISKDPFLFTFMKRNISKK
ncbi:hypothetical protein IAW_06060 [Bacillus cereus str. Schrouff]|uniref:oligosaccharide flippase family protein n=1 Tax=Bacillus cereus TaxID=1396 RepID=UPI00032F586F|nr:oligosaccharide flippase family protein [Bacillus cereus]EOO04746.1 hypothetical protein IAW_06060 [Bacillus cereus str. Schrouff]EOO81404.1 hypothetical protein IGY_05834 [Bacillus cereus K-5975c]